MANLISTSDLTREDVMQLFSEADAFRANPKYLPIDNNQQGALLFFEASTRTRIGFESAAWQLGIKTIEMYETKVTDDMSDSESVADTVRTLNPLVSYFGIRHPDAAIFDQILPYTDHPVVNCGSGDRQHPTQALIDGYSIFHKFGAIDGLNITMTGALRHSRAARSLLGLLALFENLTVISYTENSLQFPDDEVDKFTCNDTNRFIQADRAPWGPEQVLYSAGFPPKTPSGNFSQQIRDRYKVTLKTVDQLASDAIIMNPLPRIDEIDKAVDDVPQAYYFKQNELALPMRKSILAGYCLQT